MGYRVYFGTEKSLRSGHISNEDRYMFCEFAFMQDKKIKVLVVADGMGGLEDGEQASTNAVKGFLNSFHSDITEIYMAHSNEEGFSLEYTANEMRNAMVKAVQNANKEVCEKAGPAKMTGSTISAVCVFEDYAVVVNVGDSPVYFYRKKKDSLKLVSVWQTRVEQDVELGKYERYSGAYYQNDHRIYCSLGQYSSLSQEDICCAFVGQLDDGDMILMGSDGAFGRMQEHELLEQISDCPVDEEGFVIDSLFSNARKDKDDDQTAILFVVANEEERNGYQQL